MSTSRRTGLANKGDQYRGGVLGGACPSQSVARESCPHLFAGASLTGKKPCGDTEKCGIPSRQDPRPRIARQVAPLRHFSVLAQRLPLRDTQVAPASARIFFFALRGGSTLARTRTGIRTLGGSGVVRYTTRMVIAPRPGVEPGTPRSRRGMISVSPPGPSGRRGTRTLTPLAGNRRSRTARRTVSGCLPRDQWAVEESNLAPRTPAH